MLSVGTMTASSIDNSSAKQEERVRKDAVAWYARMFSGDAGELERKGLQNWLDAHPDHRRAWARLQSIRQSMQGVPTKIAMPALQDARRSRRTVLRSFALFASASAIAYVSYRISSDQTLFKPWMAEYKTRVGERRSVILADGSRMVLNTDSAADMMFDGKRTINLWRGEVLIETARHRGMTDDERPFTVQTVQGTVLALGTRFTVRNIGEQTLVAVFDDAVELRTMNGSQVRVLQAGESALFNQDEIFPTKLVDDTSIQWENGSLVVANERLGDVIAELARYRHGYLSCDDAVANIRVSGAFPIDDTDKALTVLMQSFPLKITSTTRYWVVVGPI